MCEGEATLKVELEVGVDVLETKVSTLSVQEGDTIVVSFDGRLTRVAGENIKKVFERMFPSNNTLVLEEGMKVGLVKYIKTKEIEEEGT